MAAGRVVERVRMSVLMAVASKSGESWRPYRMQEMMLTGRTLNADEGLALGLAHYKVDSEQLMAKAQELAEIILSNSPYSNWAMTTGLNRIANMSSDDGLYAESLLAGMTQTNPEIKARIDAFLNRKKKD